MLTAVTEDKGTAVEAAVPGFRVAGKTSTAQKVDPATGKYSSDMYTAVFVGFVPVEHPKLVVAVVLDEPTIGHYGGDLAGPVFRRVAEASLRYLGVTPSMTSAKLPPPKQDEAASPAPRVARAAAVPPPTNTADVLPSASPGNVSVPDATGLPAHEVVAALARAGLVPQFEGSGRAVRQNPAAGSPVPKGSAVRVILEPPS
jgi:cell division protein FtsI (penicillin-binding protein 3)